MKQISTVNMQPENKHMLRWDVLGVFGNENIRGHHIQHFKDNLLNNGENKLKDITLTPNYYAWLCLITEHLFWAMRNFCFRQNELDHDNLALMYNELITKFCDTCRKLGSYSDSQILSLFEKAVKVLEVRHAIIHKGFPNLIPVIFENKHVRNKPSVTKSRPKEKFTEESTRETIRCFSNPQNFIEIKKDFDLLMKAISSGHGLPVGF